MIDRKTLEDLKELIAGQREDLISLNNLRSRFDKSFSEIKNDTIVKLRDVKGNETISELCCFIKENYYQMIMDWELKELKSGSVESEYNPDYFDSWDIRNLFDKALRIIEEKINSQMMKLAQNVNILENVKVKKNPSPREAKILNLTKGYFHNPEPVDHSRFAVLYKPF